MSTSNFLSKTLRKYVFFFVAICILIAPFPSESDDTDNETVQDTIDIQVAGEKELPNVPVQLLKQHSEQHNYAGTCVSIPKLKEVKLHNLYWQLQDDLHGGSSGPVSMTPAQSCLLYTSPSPRDRQKSRMPSSA